MFYPVRILNPKGKLKKEIPSDLLSKKYWSDFNEAVRTNIQISKKGRTRLKTDAVYEPEYDASFFSED